MIHIIVTNIPYELLTVIIILLYNYYKYYKIIYSIIVTSSSDNLNRIMNKTKHQFFLNLIGLLIQRY